MLRVIKRFRGLVLEVGLGEDMPAVATALPVEGDAGLAVDGLDDGEGSRGWRRRDTVAGIQTDRVSGDVQEGLVGVSEDTPGLSLFAIFRAGRWFPARTDGGW